MTDLLLVHDAGHSSWVWGQVWGHLTAPPAHPPRLYEQSSLGKVIAMDLPGHSSRDATGDARLTFSDFASSITNEVRNQRLSDVVLVGHGVSAPLLMQAAADLEVPPKRVVLFAGVVPGPGKRVVDVLPRKLRLAFMAIAEFNSVVKREVKLPRAAITSIYCNGMDPFLMIPAVGRFTALPVQLFRSRLYLPDLSQKCPVTYVPLGRDKLVPPALQQRMAAAIRGGGISESLDTCHEVMIEQPQQVAEILLRYC